MKLHILNDAGAVAQAVAAHIARRIMANGLRVIGLATGRSPLAVYALLAEEVMAGRLSFTGVTSFNLDEYLGLGPKDPASFHAYMQRHFLDRIPLAAAHLPDGLAADPASEARRYEDRIRAAGGIDLQLLGIGQNGHIGFNEPGSAMDSLTRVVELSESTRQANAPDFPPGQPVPRQALTMGIATILAAREAVLIATGPGKAEAIRAALHGPVSPDCPASALQNHPAVHIYLDREAAGLLQP